MKPRYEVHSITGYTINPGANNVGGNAQQTTSYAVLDRDDCFREVGSFYSRVGRGYGPPDATRKARAEELCAHLNAEEDKDAA